MKIGDKIKAFRKFKNYTQSDLSVLTKIHPISIAKYETNKTVPQQEQILKLAKAMDVNVHALTGFEFDFKCTTIADILYLIFYLSKQKILIINGERDANDALKQETVSFEMNDILKSFISSSINGDPFQQNEIKYCMREGYFLNYIIQWERLNYLIEKYEDQLVSSETEKRFAALEAFDSQFEREKNADILPKLKELKEQKDKLEIEIQLYYNH